MKSKGTERREGEVANFSPLMAKPDEVEVQGQNAKPLRNAGVVGTAESGLLGRFGAARAREIQTLSHAGSQRSVMSRLQRGDDGDPVGSPFFWQACDPPQPPPNVLDVRQAHHPGPRCKLAHGSRLAVKSGQGRRDITTGEAGSTAGFGARLLLPHGQEPYPHARSRQTRRPLS